MRNLTAARLRAGLHLSWGRAAAELGWGGELPPSIRAKRGKGAEAADGARTGA